MLTSMLNMWHGGKRWLILVLSGLVWLTACLWSAQAADNAEARNLFRAASEALADKAYERAVGEFGFFLQKFPASPRLAEAAVSLSEALFELKRYDEVVKTVDTYAGRALTSADRLEYLKARSLWEAKKFSESAQTWRELAEKYPKSSWMPEATYWEALAFYQEKNWDKLIGAMTTGGRPFAVLAEAQPANQFVIRGRLLLAEAQLEKKTFEAAEKTLAVLAEQTLSPEQSWQRTQLTLRVQRQEGHLEDAAQTATGLLAQARTLAKPALIAESVALRAELLQDLKQFDAALEVWQTNLTESTPADRRRQALFAVIALSTANGNADSARGQLTEFLKANPNDPAVMLVRLTLGELALKDYYRLKSAQPPTTDTNLLQVAKTQFDTVLTNAAVSNITGRAYLGRGWYGWEMGTIEPAQADFKAAAESLPESNDHAIALFKWADTQFIREDFEGAAVNYSALVEQYRGVAAVRDGLLDKALYQLVRVGLKLDRQELANYALDRMLEWFPDSLYGENSLLLVGQALGKAGDIEEARKLLDDCLRRFPNSPKASEIQLARARVSVREQNWTEAIGIYTNWLGRFTNEVARPRAVFDLGWLQFKAGDEATAFNTYTNFVSDFATNALVPQAHFWLAEHYERLKEYSEAETHYQLVYQNTNVPPTELSYRARLMAGRSAFSRQQYNQAEGYFLWLITNGPPQVVNSTISPQLAAQAYFALGDTFAEDNSGVDPAKPLDRFGEAKKAYEKIPQFFPESPLVPVAWSRIANCHLQYAVQNTNRYSDAIECYNKTVESPLASVETRGLAEIGLAKIYEQMAKQAQLTDEARTSLWQTALSHYENVVYGTALREGEDFSPFVTEQAGLEGASLLLLKLNRREQAVKFYQRLIEKVPALKESVQKRIAELPPEVPLKTN